MKKSNEDIIEQFQFINGLEVDVDEGYPKIISSQFGGDPGRGFKELIQNLIDSYPPDLPLHERTGEIITGLNVIRITDFGSGLSLDKLKLLVTLGGTDKNNDSSKIGMFGIGFFSIFNPQLGTKKVAVTTFCEGHVVELAFIISDPYKKPKLKLTVLDKKITYSTSIEVWFNNPGSVKKCLHFAKSSLKYYPCKISINGNLYKSIWDEAKDKGIKVFQNNNVSGFLEPDTWQGNVSVLCKYEFIKLVPMDVYAKGGHNIYYDLRDYENKDIPYLRGYTATINNNNLRVTISRDSYYLDYNFDLSVSLLREMMMNELDKILDHSYNEQLVLANQFIMRHMIRNYVNDPENYAGRDETTTSVVKKLAEFPAYRLTDKYQKVSLLEMKQKLSKDLPLFFSEKSKNLSWLGGDFKNDFIVSPQTCHVHNGAPDFYTTLFSTIFKDIIDLDSIQTDNKKIAELVERKIISRAALQPYCKFIGETSLNSEQTALLIELNSILRNEAVREAISENIRIPVKNIKTTFFEIKEDGAYISTGLFRNDGEPLSTDFVSNFSSEHEKDYPEYDVLGSDILLGLRLDHPFIKYLVSSRNKHRAYYALTYVAHELAMCQKLLVPYSPFYHFVKEKTATAMRKALIKQMLEDQTKL
jgi:hypothetical protein